jgi:hypothetical protein
MNFYSLLEKIKNPLRKKSLIGISPTRGDGTDKASEWKNYILNGDLSNDPKNLKIKTDYLELRKTFPQRADSWLNQLADEYQNSYQRAKTSEYEKILEVQGIQIFLDKYVDENFKNDQYKMYILPKMISKLLLKTRGIMPNRKPKIVITNSYKNPKFKGLYSKNPPGIYFDRLIFIDQNEIDNIDLWIHEFAHFVVGLIPTQTNQLLEKSYKDLLDIYWKKSKKKKTSLEPSDVRNTVSVREADMLRKKISGKLGFPQYGLINFDEFFAVIIEYWLSDDPSKKLPNNAATYRFKTLVKNVLTRL